MGLWLDTKHICAWAPSRPYQRGRPVTIEQARRGQIETHKRWLNSRKNLGKGVHFTATHAFAETKRKQRDTAEKELKRAKRLIRIDENKAKKAFRQCGIAVLKAEKAQLAQVWNSQVLGVELSPDMFKLIPQLCDYQLMLKLSKLTSHFMKIFYMRKLNTIEYNQMNLHNFHLFLLTLQYLNWKEASNYQSRSWYKSGLGR
jgi:hypothetical protein